MSTYPENTPVLPPPPGEVSNFADPETSAPVLIVFSVVLPLLSIAAVSGRVYSRLHLNPPMGLDDAFSIAAVIFSIGFSITLIGGVPYGLGKHMWDIRLSDFEPKFTEYYMASGIVSSYMTLCFKLALLFLYKRLFGVSKVIHWTSMIAAVIMGIVYIGATFVGLFSCQPIQKLWYPEIDGTCLNLVPLIIAMSAFNVVTDIFLLVLPIPQVWKLQSMDRRMKIGTSLIFAAGGGACVISGIRTWRTYYTMNHPDFSWNDASWCVASLWEYHIGVICGCLPVLKPMVHRRFPKMFPESYFGTMKRRTRNRFWYRSRQPVQVWKDELSSVEGDH